MAEETAGRPIPKPSVYVDTRPFWDGAKQGKLVLQYCKDTGQFQHYPRPVSIYHRQPQSRMARSVRQGHDLRLHRDPRPWAGPRRDGLPLSVATVELDEGVRILGNVLERGSGQGRDRPTRRSGVGSARATTSSIPLSTSS